MTTERETDEIKRRHAPRLLEIKGVSGIGVERDDSGGYYLAIHIDPGNPPEPSSLPHEIEGVPVRIFPSGPFRKL
jgi:hypothetical protein